MIRDTKLTPRKQKFVAEYLRTGCAKTAAIAAGYAVNNAAKRGYELTKQDGAVRRELEKARTAMAEKAQYNAVKAMQELEVAMQFAEKTGNATAYVRAVELRMKHAGLLVERHDLSFGRSVDINAALMEGRRRAGLPLGHLEGVIEGEFAELTEAEDGRHTSKKETDDADKIFS